MSHLEALKEFNLSSYIRVHRHGSGHISDIVISSRPIDPKLHVSRPMTSERMRVAEILARDDNLSALGMARKIILEWLEHDKGRQPPADRIAAVGELNQYLGAHGILAGTTGKKGGWLTAPRMVAQASGVNETVDQALRWFSARLGQREIHIIRKSSR